MSQQKKKTFEWKVLKRLFSHTRYYRKTLYLSIVLSVVLAIITPLRPYLIQLSVDKYIKNQWLQGLIWISAVQLGILLLETLLRFIFVYRISWMGQNVVNDIRKEVFRKIE